MNAPRSDPPDAALRDTASGRIPRRGRSARVPVLLALLGLAAAGLFLALRSRDEEPTLSRPASPAEFVPQLESLPTHVRFVDVTEESGVRFHHFNGATGRRLLPETMGGGCAVLDFDRDGDQDLLFVNSAPWPGEDVEPMPTQALYENDGAGRFRDVAAEKGLDVTFYGMGVAVGDYDRDGWDDLFFSTVGRDRLFRNVNGTRFEEATEGAGISDDGPHAWSTGTAFLDYDNDGWLDLFVCRYVEWSPEIDLSQEFQITGIGRAYGPPQNFAGTFSRLYRNAGGTFRDVSSAAGIEIRNHLTGEPMGKALGVAVYDMDEDGDSDVAVANDTVRNFLFRNRGDGTFEEIGIDMGFAFDSSGNTRGAMGIDWTELGPVGAKAIVVGNFANEITAIYKSMDPTSMPFRDDAIAEGIGNPSRKYMKFGVFFFDLDLDGRPDIFESNGHLELEIATVQAEQTYAQPAQVFWRASSSASRGYEVLGPDQLGPDLFERRVGRGAAYGDLDGDGDLDIVSVSNGGPAAVFRNDGGHRNGWIRLKLLGTRSNPNGFGARVEGRAGGADFRLQLHSGRSYLSQCEQVITVGIGSAPEVTDLCIHWPGDAEPQRVVSVPAGTVREVRQP